MSTAKHAQPDLDLAEMRGHIDGRNSMLPRQRMIRNRFLVGLVLLAVFAVAGWMLKPVPKVKVWANAKSGTYHCKGSQFYEHTMDGKLMTEAEARKAAFRPANGKACQ